MELSKEIILETQLKVKELKEKSMEVWADSPYNENLTSLEDDPVMSLLLTALAFQNNEIEQEIKGMKESVLSQLTKILVPHHLMNARPAAAMVEARMHSDVVSCQINDKSAFYTQSGHTFTPLLKSTLYNAEVTKVVRLDGRRWKVSIKLSDYVSSLSGMTFSITETRLDDLTVTVGNKRLPLIKPWDCNNLPLCDMFDVKSMLFNKEMSYRSALLWLDLLAQQEFGTFVIDTHTLPDMPSYGFSDIDLIFEFSGIADDFVIDKNVIKLNTVPVVNIEQRHLTLSPSSPVARIDAAQFITLLPTESSQRFRDCNIHVRHLAGDKINIPEKGSTETQPKPGVYVFISDTEEMRKASGSVKVTYLASSCIDASNELCNGDTMLSSNVSGVNTAVVVGKPVNGVKEASGVNAEDFITRYYMVTNDRIVTPADIKQFCYAELISHYSLSANMITSVVVRTERTPEPTGCPFCTKADITIADSPYTQKVLAPARQHIERVLQRMISVRSASIVPVKITINIK